MVVSYSSRARTTTDCRLADQEFCEWWEISHTDGTASGTSLDSTWNTNYKDKKCTRSIPSGKSSARPSDAKCKLLGFNVKET